MGDNVLAGGDTARLIVVGAIAAGAACAATSLYWQYRLTSPSSSSLVASSSSSRKLKKSKSRKKSSGLPGAGSEAGTAAAMSTASTGMSSGGGPQVYEQRRAVDEYLQFHFGKPDDVLPYKGIPSSPHKALGFTARCAELCARHTKSCRIVKAGKQEGMALDVGCAVGGASFELARHFREVVGIDFSRAFVQTAKLIKERGKLQYSAVREGDVTAKYEAAVAERIDRSRVTFRQGDACKLPSSLLGGGGSPTNIAAHGRHDAVLAANLLCRLEDPAAFLRACARLVKPGGVLVLVSPYSWLEAWTPRDKWLGGYYDDASGGGGGGGVGVGGGGGGVTPSGSQGNLTATAGSSSPSGGSPCGSPRLATSGSGSAVRSFDAIHAALSSPEGGFDLVEHSDQPFLIKEHDRKFQWGCSHATVWRRRRESQEQ